MGRVGDRRAGTERSGHDGDLSDLIVGTPGCAGRLCVHVDLYRLQGPGAVDELGLRDYFDAPCLMLVEWPEKSGSALPPADLTVILSYFGDARTALLAAPTARGREWLAELQRDTSLTPYVSHLT